MSNPSPVRADPFANLGDLAEFKPDAKARPKPQAEAVREAAEKLDFVSRAPKPKNSAPRTAAEAPPMRREQRRHRTGRNVQINIKARPETLDELIRISDERGWVFGETLEHALAALKASKS